jgi:hypothetical protein
LEKEKEVGEGEGGWRRRRRLEKEKEVGEGEGGWRRRRRLKQEKEVEEGEGEEGEERWDADERKAGYTAAIYLYR